YFFRAPSYTSPINDKAFKRLLKSLDECPSDIDACKAEALRFLSNIPDDQWSVESLKEMLSEETHGWKTQKMQVLYMKFLRWALAGGANGPPIHETVWLIGKERAMYRIKTAPLTQAQRDYLLKQTFE